MIVGTSYFVTRTAAIEYYRPYEGANAEAAVDRKLAAGEIHIGRPPITSGQSCVLNEEEGRYFIRDMT